MPIDNVNFGPAGGSKQPVELICLCSGVSHSHPVSNFFVLLAAVQLNTLHVGVFTGSKSQFLPCIIILQFFLDAILKLSHSFSAEKEKQ
jgi:hypothetical protein